MSAAMSSCRWVPQCWADGEYRVGDQVENVIETRAGTGSKRVRLS